MPAAFLLAAAGWTVPSHAVQQPNPVDLPMVAPGELGYRLDHWNIVDGLLTNWITTVVQTPDGYIWCGTHDGWNRFDGVRFTRYERVRQGSDPGVRVQESAVGGDGRLWVRGSNGEFGWFDGDRVARAPADMGFPPGPVGKLATDPSGAVWVPSQGAGCYFRIAGAGRRPEQLDLPDVDVANIDITLPVSPDEAYAVEEEQPRKLLRLRTGQPPEVVPVRGLPADARVGRLFRTADGAVGVTSSHGLCLEHPDGWSLETGFGRRLTNSPLDGVITSDGIAWMATYDRELVVEAPGQEPRQLRLDEAGENFVVSMIQDREGAIWIGKPNGLFRLRRTEFRGYDIPPELPAGDPVGSLCEQQTGDGPGAVWGVVGGVPVRMTAGSGEFTTFELPGHDPDGDPVNVVHCLSDGTALAFTRSGEVIGLADPAADRLGICGKDPLCVFQQRDGTIWVGCEGGLYRRAGAGFELVSEAPHGGITQVFEGLDGAVFALSGAVLHHLEGARLNPLPITGFHSGVVTEIDHCWTAPDGSVWAVTWHHLLRLRGLGADWENLGKPLPDLSIRLREVVCDGSDHLWIASQQGVIRVPLGYIDPSLGADPVDVWPVHLTTADGLNADNVYDACLDSSGRLWLAHRRGVSTVDTRGLDQRLRENPKPTPAIEQARIDGRPVMSRASALGGGSPVRLEPSASHLEIAYSGNFLLEPERGRFRHRLLGIQEMWTDAGKRREASLYRPPPGDYEFQLQAANRFGTWGDQIANLKITVAPRWWETLWFRAAGGLAAALAASSLFWWQTGKLRRDQARRAAFSRELIASQEEERRRVATELHDSLGHELLVIKSRIDLGAFDQPELSDAILSALRQVKQISRELRPALLERVGLVAALDAMADEVSDATQIPITREFGEVDALLSDEAKMGAYRLVQEALNNVVAHSDASEAHISALPHGATVEVSVQDDGRGFDPALPTPAGKPGLGLLGMEERMTLLGARFSFHSAPGEGTTVRANIPATKP